MVKSRLSKIEGQLAYEEASLRERLLGLLDAASVSGYDLFTNR